MKLEERLVYRDGLMLVLNKPAGINVHRGPKGDIALEDYFEQLRFGLPRNPVLAHRLDKETSGCLVLGRHPKANRKLARLFAEGRVDKTYWALCAGVPKRLEGTIDLPLRKDKTGKVHKMRTGEHRAAKDAITRYKVIAAHEAFCFMECYPLTGRTHQIRAHLEALGCPILGDGLYGKKQNGTKMMLHARSITLPLYKNKDPVQVTAEPSEEMRTALKKFAPQ